MDLKKKKMEKVKKNGIKILNLRFIKTKKNPSRVSY